MADCKKLRDPHLNVSAHPAHGELARTRQNVRNEEPVASLDGMRRFLDELCVCPSLTPGGRSRTLDLIAHANQRRLLALGTSLIDLGKTEVRHFFQQLAADDLFGRLNITELRLLGCETAMSREGQAAIRDLTEILGVRVVGTTKLVYSAYFGEKGLKDRYERMLRDAGNLPDLGEERAGWPLDPLPALAPPFELDRIQPVEVDKLPEVEWPRLVRATGTQPGGGKLADAEPLVHMVDANDGRMMPRMLARPSCELVVASGDEQVGRVEILLDFDLVRVHPIGEASSAVYRVLDPEELQAWVETFEPV